MAVRLGRINVDAMLREMTAKQFQEWEIYAQLEPFDEMRQDYRIASIVQMIYNMNRGETQRAREISDFLLFEEREEEMVQQQTAADQERMMRLIFGVPLVQES